MTFEELEQEFRGLILDVARAGKQGTDRQITDSIQLSTYYMIEVVKRWRTRDITPDRVRELARKAVIRRLRDEGANQLKEVLNNAEDAQGPAQADEELVETGEGPVETEAPDSSEAQEDTVEGGGREDSEDTTPTPRRPVERPTPRPPRGPKRTYTICRKCGRSLGHLEPGAEPVWVNSCGFPGCT